MELLTTELRERLATNGARAAAGEDTGGFWPVAKLFQPWGPATWLLTESDPQDPDICFGLCDLGFGCPELGSVRLEELEALHGPGGLTIERDLWFAPDRSLADYADEARRIGRIAA